MLTHKPALVFRTADLQKTRLFYEALGLTLVEETHAGCPPHYSCEHSGLVIEFYPLRKASDPLKPGNDLTWFFETECFDVVLAIVQKLGMHRDPVKIHDKELGYRTVTLYDPDDRPVRLREIGFQPTQ